ncbi:MAG: indolepyruvate oxidoreductase [Bacteroidetes bacterium GWC2_33_15]|nr:MAG: indolepyruvate oxidoreductase [Bacteroidetes bacterium GWA2_33_15]OFX52219.1 MAG: indolepyruvate oxidoreductase [Bacteroidetes bacterium GWC2_33_15]OFX64373.1 MAG: indolepyruvate oxidoreductase [Bacteroidetes bacterium GWB2_32_14]OFX67778.1 MAG: indolepyruvate oxidoreductase [Bacteroidetes bacterium GWD2_33_33]HAN19390.1 indolepyruvate oxidoreductase subunit beta [Bacteroidales bacterium]
MKTDIVLAGVGGQGILSIAATIGMAALHSNLQLKQSEVHGMSQRGGAVQSHMRVSDKEIASDLIPMGYADIILSVEPMESLRYLPFLSKDGWLVTNSTPFVNITNYPEMDTILSEIKKIKNHIIIDADKIAEEFGSKRSSNIVMLGAASPFFNIPFESFEEGIRKIFARKGDDIIDTNLKALRAGRAFTEKNR